MLTAKQEKFVHNLVKGMTQIEAYKDAYSAKNMSDNAISREASLLLKNPKIAQRFKEIGSKTESNTIMSAQERLEWLTDLVKNEEESTNDKLRAIDIMNKMQGEYVQKIEADVKSDISINIELVDE
jgi:phage terminase small subunit